MKTITITLLASLIVMPVYSKDINIASNLINKLEKMCISKEISKEFEKSDCYCATISINDDKSFDKVKREINRLGNMSEKEATQKQLNDFKRHIKTLSFGYGRKIRECYVSTNSI